MDGSHAPVTLMNASQAKAWQNRKGEYSTLFVAACDHERRFLWVSAGHPGSTHDSAALTGTDMWQESAMEELEGVAPSKKTWFPDATFMLADAAFQLREFCMTPFRDNGRLGHRERMFNKCHAQARVRIENAFGILKMRWGILSQGLNADVAHISNVVLTCITLHNICIDWGDGPLGQNPDELGDTVGQPPTVASPSDAAVNGNGADEQRCREGGRQIRDLAADAVHRGCRRRSCRQRGSRQEG